MLLLRTDYLGNFSRWLNGKRGSPASVAGVRQFFFDILSTAETKPLVVSPTRKVELKHRKLPELLSIAKKKQTLKSIVFIDGDNSEAAIYSYKNDLSESVHIIIYMVCGKVASSLVGLDSCDKFSIMSSTNATRDAVDTDIAVAATALNLMIPSEVSFIFFSKDHFVQELISKLEEMNGRVCKLMKTVEYKKEGVIN